MPHAEIVVGAGGWNGWSVHVSQINHPLETQLQPWSKRLGPDAPEMHALHMVYPLNTPAQITAYWNALVAPNHPHNSAGFHAWLREAALEKVRVQEHPALMSRLNAIFGFLCFADAIRFACHHRSGSLSYLHELQPAEGSMLADMKIWDACHWQYDQPQAAFDILMSMAAAYWNGATANLDTPGMERPELLMPAPVTVTEPALAFEREP
jgi:hypothetical protein